MIYHKSTARQRLYCSCAYFRSQPILCHYYALCYDAQCITAWYRKFLWKTDLLFIFRVYFYYLIIILNQNQKLLWNSGATVIYNCIIIISHCCVLASASSLSYCVLLSAIFRYKERGVCPNLALNIKIPVKACWCASDILLPHNFFVSVVHFLYLHPPTVSVGLGSSLSSEAQTFLSDGVSRLGERTDLSSVSRISSQADMHKPPPRGRHSGSILTRCSKQRSSDCIYLFFLHQSLALAIILSSEWWRAARRRPEHWHVGGRGCLSINFTLMTWRRMAQQRKRLDQIRKSWARADGHWAEICGGFFLTGKHQNGLQWPLNRAGGCCIEVKTQFVRLNRQDLFLLLVKQE